MIPNGKVSPSLLSAFLATEYRVVVGDRDFVITIGATHPALDRVLDHRTWQVISAHNPDARPLEPSANEQRHRELMARVRSAGIGSWPAVNRSSDGDWPDEPGRLVVGAEPDWVHALAQEFDQVAIVAGQPGQPGRLWVYRSDRLPGTHPALVRIDS
jgi:hypothetical protein